MLAFIPNLLVSNSFIPHGHCYLWKPGLVWLHIISDSLIALAYYSIPLTLMYFVRKREDLPYKWLFLLFGAFIISCGTTHVMEVWTLWYPTYWTSGFLKALTALVSIYTAIALVPIIPKAIALPSPAQLQAINLQLEQEIFERKLLEQEIAAQEQLWSNFFQAASHAAVGLCIHDSQRRYIRINPTLAEINGLPVEAHLGKTVEEILPQIAPTLVPKQQQVLTTGQAIVNLEISGETPSQPGIKRDWLLSYFPIFDISRTIQGIGAFVVEVTERKQAERQLKAANDILFSANQQLDYQEKQLQSANAQLEQKVNERAALLQQANEQLMQKEAELRQALAQEQELSFLKSRIISTISHEYRTPLTTIGSSAQMLEKYRHKLNEQQQLKHLGRIQAAVSHLTALVSDVLFLNKAEFEKLEFQPESIELVNFFREVIEELQAGITNNCQLTFENFEENIPFQGDAKLLRQLLTNLVSNAIKYSPGGGSILVKLYYEGNNVVFTVSDQGIGIPQKDQYKLFESFERASNVGTIQGTGLGLSIVKKGVDLHGGTISVESELDVGTTFTVSLPLRVAMCA